ncbi:MAG: hypothetical protein FWG74_09730, partial [Planctomycetes bacterium]|nr:hypothetical protein [Planctomycetota bacterium]
GLVVWLRERFLHPDQDPLWGSTTIRASRSYRVNELDAIRREAEAEVTSKIHLVAWEREILQKAAELIREALIEGECDFDPDQAMFHSYLAAEFIRRAGDLPLAAEWFRNLDALLAEQSPLGQAARKQLEDLASQAGDQVNLLSALGRDGDVFEKLRKIWTL